MVSGITQRNPTQREQLHDYHATFCRIMLRAQLWLATCDSLRTCASWFSRKVFVVAWNHATSCSAVRCVTSRRVNSLRKAGNHMHITAPISRTWPVQYCTALLPVGLSSGVARSLSRGEQIVGGLGDEADEFTTKCSEFWLSVNTIISFLNDRHITIKRKNNYLITLQTTVSLSENSCHAANDLPVSKQVSSTLQL